MFSANMMFSLVTAILTTPVVAKVSLGELSDVRSFLPTQTGLGERGDDNNRFFGNSSSDSRRLSGSLNVGQEVGIRDLRFRRRPSQNSFFGNSSSGPNPNSGGSSGRGPSLGRMCHQKSWIQCSDPCDWNYWSGSCEVEE